MTEQLVFLNGEYLPLNEARVCVLDRGFIFGDGIYEVIPAYNRVPFRLSEHLQRLYSNLAATRIRNPYSEQEWSEILTRVVEAQDEEDQSLYLQITRGVAKRDHGFPEQTEPTVFVMSNPLSVLDENTFNKGVSAITLQDIRWQHCNIKAIALLPNILLRQTALDNGAQEAILIRDGNVTEGSASNIFIVRQGTIMTPPKSELLLPGITRDLVVELALENGLACKQEMISEAQLSEADEIWLTSSTKEVLPIVRLNEQSVADGHPGPVSRQMFRIFQDYKQQLKQSVA